MLGNRSKNEVLGELRSLLADVFRMRNEGTQYAKLARAHGYIDGYMRMLIDSGLTSKAELIGLVAEERERADGPATITLVA
jgi:hypothetical protein